jgi:hypothetical protein
MTPEERLGRLERAVAQLAEDSYRLSRPEQVAAKAKPDLAAIIREYRESATQGD